MNWKRRLKSEIDQQLNSIEGKIIQKSQPQEQKAPFYKNIRFRACTSLAVVMAIVISFVVAFNNLTPPPTKSGAFSVEINPAIAFVVDESQKVTSVKSMNEDGDVILSDKECYEKIIGSTMESAVKTMVEYSQKYGFIDYENAPAIKISTPDKWIKTESTVNAVENYLLQKGVSAVVFSSRIEKEEFSQKVGVAVDDMVNEIKALNTYFTVRQAQIENATNFVVQTTKDYINSIIDGGEARKELLGEIDKLNDEVKDQTAKEFFLPLNYWSVRENPQFISEYKTIQELVISCDKKVNEYEQLFGVEIASLIDFEIEMGLYSAFDFTPLIEFVDAFEGVFDQINSEIKDQLILLGADGLIIENILKIPQTVEEFEVKIKENLEYKRQSLQFDNHFEFNKERPPIDENEHKDFIDGIGGEGSFEDYFEGKKEKN